MPELAGRVYVPKLYPVQDQRSAVVGLIENAISASGGRLIFSSFQEEQVAPMYFGAEDVEGHRYGLLVYPFTTTRRETRNRPVGERRSQIRFGDPTRERDEENLIGRDVAGVDITLVLCVDPEHGFIIGLDPLIYEDLPMGISVYYNDSHMSLADEHGWGVWERKKSGGKRRASWDGFETIVGFRPNRLLDYARFEAQATALGLSPGLRFKLAERYAVRSQDEEHRLESLFGLDAAVILDIVEANFRLGVAVRGGVAEHHLQRVLEGEPLLTQVTPIDEDGKPDFEIEADGNQLTIECKTASPNGYANGDYKVEVQKTRGKGAERKYKYDQFDIVAACLFSATGVWEYRFRWATELAPYPGDPTRMTATHRVNGDWSTSIVELLTEWDG